MKISPEALQRLRSTAIPRSFLNVVQEFAPRTGVPGTIDPTGLAAYATNEVPAAERPVSEMPARPGPKGFSAPSWDEVLAAEPEGSVEPEWEKSAQWEPERTLQPPDEVQAELEVETFCMTSLKLDSSAVGHMTPGLGELIGTPLEWIVRNTFFWQGDADVPCLACRLVILVGGMNAVDGHITDKDIKGAQRWAVRRATELSKSGECFQLWRMPFTFPFPQRVFAEDISGGTERKAVQHTEKGTSGAIQSFSEILPPGSSAERRIDELVIFQHGVKNIGPKDAKEERVVAALKKLLVEILKIPVCRLVYWSCNAAVNLDVSPGSPIDDLMTELAKLSHREPGRCGCRDRIELIKPTDGKCAIKDVAQPKDLATGDGRVIRVRWSVEEEPARQEPETVEGDRVQKVLGVPIVEDATLK